MADKNSKKNRDALNKSTKSGKSSSKINFLADEEDFFSDEDLNEGLEDEDFDEDFDEPEEYDTFDEYEDLELEDILKMPSKKESAVKSSKIYSVPKKPAPEKDFVKKEVGQDVNKLVNKFVKGTSDDEIKNFLDFNSKHKEDFITGNMEFLSRKNVSDNEKKELFSKLDQITSSSDTTKANAAFVLKWLKNRDKKK